MTSATANHNQKHLGSSQIVLVPQPSQDINDPLRWPQYKKHLAFSCSLGLTFLTNFTFDGPSSGFENITLYFNIPIGRTAGLLSWFVLSLGLSNFFWIPTAAYLGKRPSFIVACTTVFVCAIWGASSKSFGSLLASTVVGGLGGGASEAVGAAIVNDLYFLHEKGRMMGIYMLTISWGSSVGPLIGGFMIEKLGWQWQKWLSAILVGINLVMIILFLPETRWDRTKKGKGTSEVVEIVANTVVISTNGGKETGVNEQVQSEESSELGEETFGTRKTYLQELSPWSGVNKTSNWLSLFLRPFPLIAYPACTFAVLACKPITMQHCEMVLTSSRFHCTRTNRNDQCGQLPNPGVTALLFRRWNRRPDQHSRNELVLLPFHSQ